ncbi:hypothetical protein K440DRAFT_534065 [Wilcoxina mikolae CBS 423.85]|nr:hypothetical protein K440DRAFT_534065 [Wilcoxina mikolae CBS 423.85]
METPEGSVYTPSQMSSSTSNLSFSQASFLEQPTPSHASALSDDNVSLTSSLSTDTDDDEAEAEWQESLQQLNLLVSLVVIPFFGKWVGRRCAYWVWTRYMTWKYPVDIVITNPKAFNAAGVVGALSSPSPAL